MTDKHTPGPWTTEPGTFWICNVGNNMDDPGVWSACPVPPGAPYPFGNKSADARLIAAAPDMLAALLAYEYVATLPYGDDLHRQHLADAHEKRRMAIAQAVAQS